MTPLVSFAERRVIKMSIREILQKAVEERASDVFIVAGLPVSVRNNGMIVRQHDEKLLPQDTELLLKES